MSTQNNQTMNTVEATVEQTNVAAKTTSSVITKLIANGAKRVNGIGVKNVNVTEKDTYTMVSFTTNKPVEGFVNDGNGIFTKGMTNVIFSSLYAITGTIKEDEDLAWLSNTILSNPKSLPLLLSGAKIDVVQHFVAAGEEYINPFTTRTNVEPTVYDHDVIINYIVGVKLSAVGNKMADKLADAILMATFA